MGWFDYTIPGIAANVWSTGYDVAKGNGPGNDWLMGDPKVGLNPNDAKLQGGDYLRSTIQNGIAAAGGRAAPQSQAASLDQGAYNQWRQQQMGLANQLGAVASGQQKGAGELAVGRQIQQGLAAQQSAANSARGANALLGARAAVRGASDLGINGAGLAAQSAMQDQANARGQLAGVLGQGAQQDIGIAGQNAGMQQQNSLANMAAQLQSRGMNDAATLGYLSQLTGIDQAELQARLQQEQFQIAQRNPGHLGDIFKMGGQAIAAGA
jgi:hypothetical protein